MFSFNSKKCIGKEGNISVNFKQNYENIVHSLFEYQSHENEQFTDNVLSAIKNKVNMNTLCEWMSNLYFTNKMEIDDHLDHLFINDIITLIPGYKMSHMWATVDSVNRKVLWELLSSMFDTFDNNGQGLGIDIYRGVGNDNNVWGTGDILASENIEWIDEVEKDENDGSLVDMMAPILEKISGMGSMNFDGDYEKKLEDSIGMIKLKVADSFHPIFEDIELLLKDNIDATNNKLDIKNILNSVVKDKDCLKKITESAKNITGKDIESLLKTFCVGPKGFDALKNMEPRSGAK